MALRVDDDDVLRFAEAHDEVAGEIAAATRPDPALIAAMTTGYGPVGAEFTAAVAEFQAAFHASGTALSNRYQTHAGNLRQAAAGYVSTDEGGAAGIASSGAI
jgi:hypothetical protein